MPNQSELKSTKKENQQQQRNGPERAENAAVEGHFVIKRKAAVFPPNEPTEEGIVTAWQVE